MPGRTIQVAIIGAGLWGARAHLFALKGHEDVEVVALVDTSIERADAIAREHDIPRTFGDAVQLFSEVDELDAVIIATPTDTHRDVVLAACEKGVHILCEKPLAYNVEQAQEMVEALHSKKLIGMLGFLFRCSPVVERMKELIDQGHIGEVQLVQSVSLNAQFMDPERPRHWKMRRVRANGGVFVEYGSHSIDLARWLGGPFSSVVAHGVTLVRQRSDGEQKLTDVDVDDAASWIATYANGGEALFRAGWASLPIGGEGLRVYGSRGSLAWQAGTRAQRQEQLLSATVDAPEPEVLFEFAPPFDEQVDSGTFPLGLLARYNKRLIGRFVNAVQSHEPTSPSFADGLAAQKVLEGIRVSLDEHRWVAIEDE